MPNIRILPKQKVTFRYNTALGVLKADRHKVTLTLQSDLYTYATSFKGNFDTDIKRTHAKAEDRNFKWDLCLACSFFSPIGALINQFSAYKGIGNKIIPATRANL